MLQKYCINVYLISIVTKYKNVKIPIKVEKFSFSLKRGQNRLTNFFKVKKKKKINSKCLPN